MPVAASAVWEVRASGAGVSDNNGGAWQPLTVSTFSGTDLVVDGVNASKVTSVTHNFVAADVGTRLLITAGTGWTGGFYTILSVAANAATLNASPAAVATTGGTWNEVGADFSQQNAPQVAVGGGVVTSSVTTSVITFTGGTYTPTNADVGNTVQVISGTNTTPGTFLQITATTATTWTMSGNVVSAGTATNVVANMGGALLTLAKLAAATAMVASNKAYCAGAFTASATITFAQGAVNTAAPTRLIGYGTVRGDSTMATLALATNTGLTGISATGTHFSVEQIAVDCGSLGTSIGISVGQTGQVLNCKVSNFTTAGISCTNTAVMVANCEATGGTAAATAAINLAFGPDTVMRCYVHDNACPGIRLTNGQVQNCLVVNNSGASSDGIFLIAAANQILGNTCHNNGRDGIRFGGTSFNGTVVRNNLVTNNGGFGITLTSGTALPASFEYDGNAYGGGASANTSGTVAGTTGSAGYSMVGIYGVNPYTPAFDVTLSASPYVGPTSGSTANFGLNNVAGGGAACRKAGSPGTWPGNTGTTGFPDFGAVQTASGGGAPGIIVPV